MKIISILFLFFASSFAVTAQSYQQQRNDSVCLLLKNYITQRSNEKIYQLLGEGLKRQISPENLKAFMESNIFPLGGIKGAVFEKVADSVSFYKVDFSTTSLYLLIAVDPAGKVKTILFQPYKPAKAKKNYAVPFSNPLVTHLDKKVDTIAASYIDQLNTVGMSIGILKDGTTHFYGYGETEEGNKIIPGPSTIFEIGSISKTFTATLLAIAVGEGKVRLDDPVNKYLPDSIPTLNYNSSVITLKDLSNHTSAIPPVPLNFQSAITDPKDPYAAYPVDKLYGFLKHLQLTREPGKKYEYSNTAVGLLGTILQRIYHGSYEELIGKYICNPLGMNDTRVSIRKKDSAAFAKGYDAKGSYNGPWNLSPAFAGAGAIRSTARDMLKYANANTGDAPGSLRNAIQLTHDTTFSDKQVTLGLGWLYIQAGNKKVLFHNGATGGYRAFLAIDVQKKIAVVILCNSAISPDEEGAALMKWLEDNQDR